MLSKLSNQNLPWADIFSHAREGMVITDPAGVIVAVNPAFSELTGYSHHEAIGATPALLKSGLQDESFYARLWQDLIEQGYWQGEIWNRRKDGEHFAERLSISAVRDPDGNTTHYVALLSDITAEIQNQRLLKDLAYLDPLTRLPNRTLLNDRLQQGLAHAQRHNELLAVCYLDLDGFKPVNDNYGHRVGDYLLIEVASRLQRGLRCGDTLARVGGDEFVLVLPELKRSHEAASILQRLRACLEQPFRIGDRELQLTASIGLALYPLDAHDSDSLLESADRAMYAEKASRSEKRKRPYAPPPALPHASLCDRLAGVLPLALAGSVQ